MKVKHLALVILGLAMAAGAATDEAKAVWRTVPVPAREHGYVNFETTVVSDAAALAEFLGKLGADPGAAAWNRLADFAAAIHGAGLDFSKESLVLLRHSEGSGSTAVNFNTPVLDGQTLVCRIDRRPAGMGTADMAYYCFALAVRKEAVTAVAVEVAGGRRLLVRLPGTAATTQP